MMHFNSHYAERSDFGRLLVNSGLTLALVLGQSVSDVSQQAMANLGFDEVRFTHPVFVGDPLYAESIVLAVRESASRPPRRNRHRAHPRAQPGRRRVSQLRPQCADLQAGGAPTTRGCFPRPPSRSPWMTSERVDEPAHVLPVGATRVS